MPEIVNGVAALLVLCGIAVIVLVHSKVVAFVVGVVLAFVVVSAVMRHRRNALPEVRTDIPPL